MDTTNNHFNTTTHNAGGSSRTLQASPSSSVQKPEFSFDPVQIIRDGFVLAVLAVIALFATAPAKAQSYSDMARVVSVVPMTQRYNVPQQVCNQMPGQVQYQYQQPQQPGNGGAILGAVTGGLIGRSVGRGQGKLAATGIGAAVGAVVGDRMQNGGYNNQPQQVYVPGGQSCYTVDNWVERQAGAVVVFEIHGRSFTQTLGYVPNYRPGDMVPVNMQANLN